MSTRTDTPTIGVDALRDLLERHLPLTVLDVRPAAERAEWSIPGSLHIDAYERLKSGDAHALDGLRLPEGAPVVAVCAAGRTSLIAADLLRRRGIEALSLDGGMAAWSLAWNVAEVPLPGSAAAVLQVRRTGKGCLSYLIGAGGRAVVIDPALDPRVYLDLAAANGWRISDVIETHIHADHLSRARTLAQAAGAVHRLPEQWRVGWPHVPLRDGDGIAIGDARLLALRTPGHTGESTCYLLDGRVLFTGDTLFPSGVGRPDLEASADEARERAHLLYASLRRLLALPAGTLVLAGHASEPVPFDERPLLATLGDIREQVALLAEDEDSFVASILARIPPAPPNHRQIVALNEGGLLDTHAHAALEAGANRCAVR